MPRPKFLPTLPKHVSIGGMERRMEKVSMRDQRPAPDQPKPTAPPKPPLEPADDPDYNVGG